MYETYWQLQQRPFENGVDQKFYYPSETHQGALLKLRYTVDNRRGAALLSGPSGSGKSLLVQSLRRQLGEQCTPFVHLVFPQMPVAELLAYLATELGSPTEAEPRLSIDQSVQRIAQVLSQNAARGRHAIVAIDEAHLLDDTRALEAMRLLLNFQSASQPALTLLLVGQPPLLPAIDRMPGLEERLAVKCLLRTFSVEETVSYVSHRLTAAGAKRTIFDSAALETLHQLTGGVPRRINRLCDLALLVGFAEERSSISADQLETICNELVTVAPE